MKTPEPDQVRGRDLRHVAVLCSLGLFVSLSSLTANRALGQSGDIPAQAQNSLQHYLDLDCNVTSPQKKWFPSALEQVLRISQDEPGVENTMKRLLESGMDAQEQRSIRESLKIEYNELKKFLEEKPDLGLRPDDMEVLQSAIASQEAYIRRTLDRIEKRYRQRSAIVLLALAKRGSASARKALDVISRMGSAGAKEALTLAREQVARSSRPEHMQ